MTQRGGGGGCGRSRSFPPPSSLKRHQGERCCDQSGRRFSSVQWNSCLRPHSSTTLTMGDTRGGGGGGGGWTVADTSTIRATRRSGGKAASSSASAPSPVPGPAQQHHHIRWSNDVLKETPEDPGGGGGDISVASPAFRGAGHPGDESESRETAKPKPSVLKKNTERGGEGEDYSLDKLLDGLTELSQTLPGKST